MKRNNQSRTVLIYTKWILVSYFFLSVFQTQAQIGVLDAHVVSERGYWFNVFPKPYDNGFNYYPNDFTEDEKKLIRDIESGIRYTPFDFLLHEDENWAIRTWYQIDLKEQENTIFKKHVQLWLRTKSENDKDVYYYDRGDSTQLIDTIYKYMKIDDFTLYNDYRFNKTIDRSLIDLNQADSVTHIRLMIDWNYDKKTGVFKNYIVGFGLYSIIDNKEKCFGYLYYPQLRILLRHFYPGYSKPSFNEYFQDRKYKAELIKKVNLYQNTFYDYEERFESSYYEDRTELVPLLDIELLNDEFKYSSTKVFSGKMNFETKSGEEITGNTQGYFMHGEWVWKYNNGKKRLKVNFEKGVPHGDFVSYWENGKIKENGVFEFGKRNGEWLSYNEKGILIAKRNYLNGWNDGKQETYYSNGNKHLVYHYKEFLVDGKYENYYPSGTLMANGYLEKAIMKGKWNFNIEIDKAFIDLNSKIKSGYPKLSDEILKDRIISFDADYIHGYNEFFPFGGLDLDINVGEMK